VPDKSDNRTFELTLNLDGKRINQRIGRGGKNPTVLPVRFDIIKSA